MHQDPIPGAILRRVSDEAGRQPIPSTFYRVSVKALVTDEDGRVLLVQTGEGDWEVPGGGWEHGETIDECLRREIDEELGVGVKAMDLATIYPVAGMSRGGYHRLKLAVRAALTDEPFNPGDGMVAAKYVTREEFRELLAGAVDADMVTLETQLWPKDRN